MTSTPEPTATPSPTAAEPTAEPTRKESAGMGQDGDGDGRLGEADVRNGIALLFGDDAYCAAECFDRDGDGHVVAAAVVAVIRDNAAL